MKMNSQLYTLAIFYSITAVAFGQREKRLRTFLFNNYDSDVRPVYNYSDRIDVNLTFELMSIVEVNTQQQFLKSRLYFTLKWNDQFLNWENSNYSDISFIMVSGSSIWKPDLGIKNSVEGYEPLSHSKSLVEVRQNGKVFFAPYGSYETLCDISARSFPFDTQSCTIEVAPWLTMKKQQSLRLESDHYHGQPGKEDAISEWEFIEHFGSCVDSRMQGYQHCTFELVLKRRTGYFVLYLVCPGVLMSIMTSSIFLLPSSSGEKVSFSVSIFLACSVFQTALTDYLPKTSDFSYTSFFIQYHFIVAGVQTIIAVLLVRLGAYTEKETNPTSKLLISLALRFRRKSRPKPNQIKCLSTDDPKEQSVTKEEDVTWEEVRCVLDNIFFCIFLTGTITLVACLIVLISK